MEACCPTCDVLIDPTRAPIAAVRGGRVVTFCSQACAAGQRWRPNQNQNLNRNRNRPSSGPRRGGTGPGRSLATPGCRNRCSRGNCAHDLGARASSPRKGAPAVSRPVPGRGVLSDQSNAESEPTARRRPAPANGP